MMYADLKHIIESMPDDYFQKDFQKSLFLLAANTAQRANTLVSVKFDEVYINKDRYNGQITAITVTFNTTKGTKDHAGIRKTIRFNRNDPLMCFIEAFRKYLQSRYNIDLESYNTEREKFKGKKIWNITRLNLTHMVYNATQRAGYPLRYFSAHSFRSGVVCQMLLNSLNGDINRFNHVFNDARVIGDWVEKSSEFYKYIKKATFASLVASRFVDPNIHQKLFDEDLQDPIRFHNLQNLISSWKSNVELKFEKLLRDLFSHFLETLKYSLNGLIQINNSLESHIKMHFSAHTINSVFYNFCKVNNPEFLKKDIDHKNQSLCRAFYNTIKKEIVYELLKNNDLTYVRYQFIPYVDDWESNELDFSTEEKIFLLESIEKTSIEFIHMNRNILAKLKQFSSLKKEYSGLSNKQILEILKTNLQNFDEDAENDDFTSKLGLPYTEAEDKFIHKCYNTMIPV